VPPKSVMNSRRFIEAPEEKHLIEAG